MAETAKSSPSEETHQEADPFKQDAFAKMNAVKVLVLGLIMHANDNTNQFPRSFDDAAQYLGGSTNPALTNLSQFELVIQGSLTNVTNPRSQVKRHSLYERTVIKRGATVGANATIVCGITLGRYSFIAAGAVVAKDVPDYGFIVGVPGRLKGWMSRHGHLLDFANGDQAICPESGYRYELTDGRVRCLDLDEESPLPPELSAGSRSYDDFKN